MYEDWMKALRESALNQIDLKVFQRCTECNRKLETDTGKKLGLGSVCRKKFKHRYTIIPRFEGELRSYAYNQIAALDVDFVVEYDFHEPQIFVKGKHPPYEWAEISECEPSLESLRMILNPECDFVYHNLYEREIWVNTWSKKKEDITMMKDNLMTDEEKLIRPIDYVMAPEVNEPEESHYKIMKREGSMNIFEASLWDMIHGPGKWSIPDYLGNSDTRGSKFQQKWCDYNHGDYDWDWLVNYQNGDWCPYQPSMFGDNYDFDIETDFRLPGGEPELKEGDPYYHDIVMWARLCQSYLEHEVSNYEQHNMLPTRGSSEWFYWWFDADGFLYAYYPVRCSDGELVRACDLWRWEFEHQADAMFEEHHILNAEIMLDWEWTKPILQQYLDNLQMTSTPA